MPERVSVVGLGKLGLCLAACLAERGFETLGIDIEEKVVKDVNNGTAPWLEPGLQELMARHGGRRLRASSEHLHAIQDSDITFILVATPSNADGAFSNRFVEAALERLGAALRKSKKQGHLFVISSTVMPGSTDSVFIPLLETASGLRVNRDFGVCFDPDFVALGNVINGFLRPDLVLLGESNSEAGARLARVHQQLHENEPSIAHMSIINAELAKVCLNTYITLKITFANSVANLCEQIPGANVDEITRAIGNDRRISPYYFRGGLSFGGTCFPRDTHAYTRLAFTHKVQADLIDAVIRVNDYQNDHLTAIVLKHVELQRARSVAVLGLAFTPNTSTVVESPGMKLIANLLKHDLRVIAYDPVALDNARAVYGSAIEYMESAADALNKVDLAVLTLRLPEFNMAVEEYSSESVLTVIDCWRILDPDRLGPNIRLVPLGVYAGQ